MEIQNKIGEQVFDKLRSKFKQITLGDDEGNATQDPSETVFFNFNYTDNQGHDHGNITVSLIDRTMKIYYSKNISKDLDGSELTEWYTFLQDMRKTAMSNLYGFDTHDISKSALNIADIQSTVNRNNMKESKMYGSKKRSYQDHGPAKIIVRHTENIDPEIRGSRSRKIESVFVETFEGERFKMPFNSLPGTRAMARHIGQGGRPYDDLGESITTMVNEIASLRPFVSRNRNAIYEDETTTQMVEAAREYYAETRKTLGKLKGPRGYKAYAESFEVTEAFEFIDEEAVAMKERFTKKRFNDKMEMAMPIVQKAFNLKNAKPKTPGLKPIAEFEEWAEEVTEMPKESFTVNTQEVMGLSDHDMEAIKGIIAGTVEMDDFPDLMEKLYEYYLNSGEMPYGVAKARTGDPYQWIFDKLDSDFGNLVEANEELCSKECCGKPVSKCHCGPECEHCDCHEKNKLKENDVSEVKSGSFNSKMIGRRVKVIGNSVNNPENHIGEIGTIRGASREDTLSPLLPFVVEYNIELDDGTRVSYRRESVRVLKEDNVTEVKSGSFKSKMIGRRVKVIGQSSFGDSEHDGEIGTITRASREHTFSQMHPFKIEYGIKLDNGTRVSYRRESVRVLKENNVSEVKSGSFKSKMIGRRVKVIGNSVNNPENHIGEIGTIRGASREDTLSRLLPFVVEYSIELDDGTRVSYRRENIKPIKDQSINEGTWALPDTPEKKKRLSDLMSSPLPYGIDGENVTSAIYDLIGDDDLFDELYASSKIFGPLADSRVAIQSFIDSRQYRGWSDDEIAGLAEARKPSKSDIAYDKLKDCPKCGHELEQGYRGGTNVKRCRSCGWEKKGYDYQKFEEDVVLPKATYSDYLDVYKSSDVGGTDTDDDAKRMVKSLKKKGKGGDEKAAKGALKRMAEQEAKKGLHINESIKRLQREAGIIK